MKKKKKTNNVYTKITINVKVFYDCYLDAVLLEQHECLLAMVIDFSKCRCMCSRIVNPSAVT
eukprot:3853266-Amphidinium_carterae.1